MKIISKTFSLMLLATIPLVVHASDLQEGVSLYEKGDYAGANTVLSELLQEDIGNPQLNYYYGRVAYELGDFEEALKAFERVLIMEENHQRARLELARCYIALEMYPQAREELVTVLHSQPPKAVSTNVKALLAQVDGHTKRGFFNGAVTAGFGYDTNVNTNPGRDVLIDYLNTEKELDRDSIDADDKEEGGFAEETVNLRYLYDIGDPGETFLNTALVAYNQNFFDHSDFDVLYMSLRQGVGYSSGELGASLPLVYSNLRFGGDAYLQTLGVEPTVTYAIRPDLRLRGAVSFQKRYYENDQRDSHVLHGGVGIEYRLDAALMGAYIGVESEEATDREPLNFSERDSWIVKLFYQRPIPGWFDMALRYHYKKSEYDDYASEKTEKTREDDYHYFTARFSRKITAAWQASLGGSWITNDSNYSPSDYDKSLYSLNLSYQF